MASFRNGARDDVVQHLLFDGWVGVDGERQSTLGTKHSTSAMQEPLAEGAEAQETPTSGTLSAGSSLWWVCNHLKLSG
jgi:hypothetical protein